MKKKELLLFASILLLALLAWVGMEAARRLRGTAAIRITVKGEEFGIYPLEQDREISIGDTNVCRIQDGRVLMVAATCPDHLCMHQPAVDKHGGMIVCLPNQVVIEGISSINIASVGTVGIPETSFSDHSSTGDSSSGEAEEPVSKNSGVLSLYNGWDKAARVSKTGFYLDTVVTITLYGTEDPALIQNCFDLISDYESMLSRTAEDSDIWRLNHSKGKPVEVSEETAFLLNLALRYCALSQGAFDITIAPVVDLWDFHEDGSHALPDQYLLNQALSHVDYRKISIDGTTITLGDPQAEIDLGGVAKGYIADKLRDYLLSRKIPGAMIDLGGNILTVGVKPDGVPWRIGIRKPFAAVTSDLIATVTIPGGSVVTSGTYERYFEKNGEFYHHILDVSNGYPADTGLLSVSVLSESSAEGDALSTACFLLGAKKGLEQIEALDGVEALFVLNNYSIMRSSGCPEA